MRQSSYIKFNHHYAASAAGCVVLLLFLTQFPTSSSLIVPNELPSLLSLVYSNIPPIKKGTDSRVGFGFRLGEHADFQVMVELGPQKNTRPIGDPESMDGSSFNKRQVNKRQQLAVQQELTSTERSAATWLEKWSNDANVAKKNNSPKVKSPKKQSSNKHAALIPAMPQMPDQTLRQLQMLYKMATSTTSETIVPTTERLSVDGEIDAAKHLQERLKQFKAPANTDQLQGLLQKSPEKSKTQITKELMDVNLDV